jgi:two-component system sensor histidine kinase ChvG
VRLKLNFRGPRLGTKLALMGLALLVVPWFSYLQLVEMERLLIQGQSQAQLLTAEGISTLFNGREDLFNDLPVTLEDFEALYAQPLENTIRLDGDAEDWGKASEQEYLTFGSGTWQDSDFRLLLGERSDYLYVHMRINDDQLVYRNPEFLRLDNADHIRLNYIGAGGEDGRMSLVFGASNVLTGFAMDEQWRYAATGDADNRVQGVLRPLPASAEGKAGGGSAQEVALEFRIPLSLLGSRQYFGLTFVDVDDPLQRQVVRSTQTLPKEANQNFNLVVLRTPEVRNIVQGLGYSGAKILVIDSLQRVRAEVGATRKSTSEDESALQFGAVTRQLTAAGDFIGGLFRRMFKTSQDPAESRITEPVNQREKAVEESLAGAPITLRNPVSTNEELILAAHPIVSADQVIGTVVVEQNIDDILRFQRTALEQVLLLTLLSLLAIFLALIAFAGRLAWRIRNLRQEASSAIDARGRLRRGGLLNEMNAGDEIGDLARSVSNMLEKLKQHNGFLENMPRTLRHEINNPLNTLSTSLQNLADEHPDIDSSKYLESAKRGVHRIGSIVQNLADAANLEEALEAEELEEIDLNELLASYVANCGASHDDVAFEYSGSSNPAIVLVSDFRIEQMLDKLVDNAVDFHRNDTPIRVHLECFGDIVQIAVANRGPALPEAKLQSIFDSMVSHRGPDNRLHFGLGLHVVRIIAEHHGGTAMAANLEDHSGVALLIRLPLVYPVLAGDQAASES